MPFYGDNLNYNRNFKKDMQYDNLKQKSSGLGFFVFAYSLTMTACAVIIAEVFKAFGSAKYIYSDLLYGYIYFRICRCCSCIFLYKAFKKQFK